MINMKMLIETTQISEYEGDLYAGETEETVKLGLDNGDIRIEATKTRAGESRFNLYREDKLIAILDDCYNANKKDFIEHENPEFSQVEGQPYDPNTPVSPKMQLMFDEIKKVMKG